MRCGALLRHSASWRRIHCGSVQRYHAGPRFPHGHIASLAADKYVVDRVNVGDDSAEVDERDAFQ
jgi:hypothetical protein